MIRSMATGRGRMVRSVIGAAVVLTMAAVVSGCGGSSSPTSAATMKTTPVTLTAGQPQEVDLQETPGPYGNWSISPAAMTVKQGTTVTFDVVNKGMSQHNLHFGAPYNAEFEDTQSRPERLRVHGDVQSAGHGDVLLCGAGPYATGHEGHPDGRLTRPAHPAAHEKAGRDPSDSEAVAACSWRQQAGRALGTCRRAACLRDSHAGPVMRECER